MCWFGQSCDQFSASMTPNFTSAVTLSLPTNPFLALRPHLPSPLRPSLPPSLHICLYPSLPPSLSLPLVSSLLPSLRLCTSVWYGIWIDKAAWWWWDRGVVSWVQLWWVVQDAIYRNGWHRTERRDKCRCRTIGPDSALYYPEISTRSSYCGLYPYRIKVHMVLRSKASFSFLFTSVSSLFPHFRHTIVWWSLVRSYQDQPLLTSTDNRHHLTLTVRW